ncbi:GMC oxidoreductase-domain-containing protein [Gongronella butleri]|nr:GMC oxidoreductase-domain-containing protein [Gongronella butleri]
MSSGSVTLGPKEQTSLKALIDTFIAPLDEAETKALLAANHGDVVPEDAVRALASAKGTDYERAIDEAVRFFEKAAHPSKHGQVLLVLKLLNTTVGTAILTGYFAAVHQLKRQDREKIILSWKSSSLLQLRQLYKILMYIAIFPNYANSRVLKAGAGYPYLDNLTDAKIDEPYKMLSLEQAKELTNNQWDVIVIGSGAGGGVIAAEAAKAGKSVLVIEKGKYYTNDQLGQQEYAGYVNLYEAEGLFSSKDGAMGIAAGSTFGGGTTVNWSASLKPHAYVYDEWAKWTDNQFDVEAFKQDLETVVQRIGATTDGVEHNRPNEKLKAGAERLGYPFVPIPQNTRGVKHECNMCFAGCRHGVKQGVVNSWLRDAEAAGAKFMDQTFVERVIIKDGVAKGVSCVKEGQTIDFEAKVVVVSAGSLNSPNVLRRSGLKNKNIGRHLRVHPATIVQGLYEEDQTQDMYDGHIMTIAVESDSPDDHYGAKIEVPAIAPGLGSVAVPWQGALHHKQTMVKYRHSVPLVVIGRDLDSVNRVYEEKDHRVVVEAQLSKHDEKVLAKATIEAFKILAATGAKELQHSQFGVPCFTFDKDVTPDKAVEQPDFQAWLKKIERYGFKDGYFTAHQLGSNRMGACASTSVTQVTGETWEVQNLFVGDGSILASASGVNPMVTIESLCLGVSRNVVARASELAAQAKQDAQ